VSRRCRPEVALDLTVEGLVQPLPEPQTGDRHVEADRRSFGALGGLSRELALYRKISVPPRARTTKVQDGVAERSDA